MERPSEGGVTDDQAGESTAGSDGGLSPAQLRAALRAVLLGALGFAAIQIAALLLAVPAIAIGGELTTAEETLLGTAATGVGAVGFVLVVLEATDRDRSFLDLSVPGRRDVGYAVGGSVLLIGAFVGLSVALAELGVAPSEHGISQELTADDAWVALALVALSYLAVGPGEELLYRNLVQKSLYGEFSREAAVVVGGLAFAVVHLPAYATQGINTGTGVSLGIVFLLSLGLGWLYARTDNVLVPMFAHGTFNAVQFLLLYLQLSG